jgi:undecaprenyl diphosphate synthase
VARRARMPRRIRDRPPFLSRILRRERRRVDPGDVPRSVAIIPDGNGRWASAQELPVEAGHREGTRALRRTVEAAIDLGIESLTVYAFSTENWMRPTAEVDDLMEIFGETIERELPDLAAQGVRTRFIGRRDRAPEWLQQAMAGLEEETAGNDRLQLWIAFDYGGRAEIVEAVKRVLANGADPARLDEDAFARYLYAPELPDPDLLIRTSGELRISNFLLWQLAYAELIFVDTLWPDFGEEQLREALEAYAGRRRRFGGR